MSANPASASSPAAGPSAPVGALGTLVSNGLVKWHMGAAVWWLAVGMFAGLAYAYQLINQYFLPGDIEYFSPGRIRVIHTNMIAFGFLFNGFLAMLYWVVPRLTGKRVLSHQLGWLIFVVWQSVLCLAWLGFHLGQIQAVEWGETQHNWPLKWLSVDNLVVVGALLVSIQFYAPIITTKEKSLYVTLWYFSAAFVWTALTYLMGNYLPQFLVPGTAGGPFLGLYIHDLVGLFVTPMGWGMMYFFVPILLRKPIWSHALSLVGFWGLAFFYPLQGVHHFLGSPIPMFAQYGAVVSTIGVEIVVLTVIVNFFMTLRGSETALRDNIAVRWFFVGALNYFITCLQCAFQTTLTFQQYIHFTDWVVAHAHLVMYGVFTFWINGMVLHLWPKVCGREWWSNKLISWHFWLSAIGLLMMFLDLTCAGLIQGFMWKALAPWEDSIRASIPFWMVRAWMGIAILTGHTLLIVNMIMTAVTARQRHIDVDYTPYETPVEEGAAV